MTELYPAIDLRGGRAVRLLRGDYAAETVYSDDPVAVARSFEAAGARWIHVVDLDAARSGEAGNLDLVAAVARSVSSRIETGGGVRSVAAAERLLDAGVARVVVGTAAVERPELVTELAGRFPGQVAVGLDARGRQVAVKGWTETTGADLVDAGPALRRGGGQRPRRDRDRPRRHHGRPRPRPARRRPRGHRSRRHRQRRRRHPRRHPGPGRPDGRCRSLAGIIVGRALYEGRFTVEEALACLAPV